MREVHGLASTSGPDDKPVIPAVTVAQMREVDRIMIQELGIELTQMMENAGRAVAEQTRSLGLGGTATGRRVVVAAGWGANGGGGLAAARRLLVWGAEVVVLTSSSQVRGETSARQLEVARRLGVRIDSGTGAAAALAGADAVVDALIGYGLQGPPRPPVADLIGAINDSGVPVISLDIPSGLDADRGTAPGAVVHALATVTLALPKAGLLAASARTQVGYLYLADISVPPTVYQRLGLKVGPIFARSDIVELAHL